MTTTEQSFINGFVKRAAEYGVNHTQALELLKQAAPPAVAPQHLNEAMRQPNQRSFTAPPSPEHGPSSTYYGGPSLEALDSRNRPKIGPIAKPAAGQRLKTSNRVK